MTRAQKGSVLVLEFDLVDFSAWNARFKQLAAEHRLSHRMHPDPEDPRLVEVYVDVPHQHAADEVLRVLLTLAEGDPSVVSARRLGLYRKG